MAQYSNYQKKVISNYYDNLDTIMLTKLQELTTELYLAESESKKAGLWTKVAKSMENLKIPQSIQNNILAKKDLKILAENINIWLKKS